MSFLTMECPITPSPTRLFAANFSYSPPKKPSSSSSSSSWFSPVYSTPPPARRPSPSLYPPTQLYSSYLLTNVPLAIAWHERIWPNTARDYTSATARFHWFIITGGLLLFSFAVANSIPFFGAFQVRSHRMAATCAYDSV